MKKFNNKKSVLEKGGMMIEALAMLGLIAVVTPTMYKKSAERTMEVEDINTASAIRTYMNAVNSYMSANYIELLEAIPEAAYDEENNKPGHSIHKIEGDELEALQKFLPYQYQAKDNLYNYGEPQFSIVRSGDNLTAFVLFPAKASTADDSIGQERTVRIASLVGSNGGYIRNEKARGVGGVWSVEGDDLDAMFTSKPEYSLVTSSVDVVNSSTGIGQADNTKYLQRTKENADEDDKEEYWRNTMRTDLYMGDFGKNNDANAADPDDEENHNFYSIYNINRLMVGADETDTLVGREIDDDSEAAKNYGLYIADKADSSDTTHGVNAYIAGSLQAAAKRFFVNDEEMSYSGPKIQLGGLDPDETTGVASQYLISATTKDDSSAKNRIEIMPTGTDPADSNPVIIVADEGLADEGADNATEATNLLIAKNGTKKANPGDSDEMDAPSYGSTAPEFPVVVDSNMAVNGVLAAGQIDTQKIRTSSISVGSENIDDAVKWMDVDADGVHIKDLEATTTDDGDGLEVSSAKIQMEVNDSGIAMRVDEASKSTEIAGDEVVTQHNSQILMNDDGVKIIAQGGENHAVDITTGDVAEHFEESQITIGNPNDEAYRVKYNAGGNVDMVGTTLQVTDNEGKPILTARGNDTAETGDNAYNDPSVRTGDNNFRVAVHGNTVFTGDKVANGTTEANENGAVQYLAMGKDDSDDFNAAVNIVNNSTESTSANISAAERILFIDMDAGSQGSYVAGPNGTTVSTNSNQAAANNNKLQGGSRERTMHDGTIYVRKGLIDIAPTNPGRSALQQNGIGQSADTSHGTVRAARFVANNIDVQGNMVKYTSPIKSEEINLYNTGSESGSVTPYDTYMVNPAYTSVMKDIKLTSRLGARLSDVLPDFITKSIYLAQNTNDEDILTNVSSFTLVNGTNGRVCVGGITEGGTVNDGCDTKKTSTILYASPFLGTVPAPQCPPGYGRAITISPYEFQMGQAGVLETASGSTLSSGYEVSEYDMLRIKDRENANTSGTTLKSELRAENASDQAALREEIAQGKPRVSRLRALQAGETVVEGLEENPIMMKMGTLSGYHHSLNPSSSHGIGHQFYYNINEPNTGLGDLDNRVKLEGGLNDSARAYLETASGSNDPHIADLHENSYADMRDQLLYLESIGYVCTKYDSNGGCAEAHLADNQDHDYAHGQNPDPSTTMKAQVDYNVWEVPSSSSSGSSSGTTSTTGVKHKRVENDAYFLTTTEAGQTPLTFQQSTWLRTAQVELKNNDYVRGWAALMGFIYPNKLYGNIAESLGAGLKTSSDAGDRLYYWNVFPVKKGTLRAQITTYCFIDNKSYGAHTDANNVVHDGSATETVNWNDDAAKTGSYRYEIFNNVPTNYNPPAGSTSETARKYLNDPELKYNELW